MHCTQMKKTKSEVFVIFSSGIRECPFFCIFGGAKTVQKRTPAKKDRKKGPPSAVFWGLFYVKPGFTSRPGLANFSVQVYPGRRNYEI